MHRSGFRAKVKQIPPQTIMSEAPLPALERRMMERLGSLGQLIEREDRSVREQELAQALLKLCDADLDLAYSLKSIQDDISARMDTLEQTMHAIMQAIAIIKRELKTTADGVVKALDKPTVDYSENFADVKSGAVKIVEAMQPALQRMAAAMDEIKDQEPKLPAKAEKALTAIATGLNKVSSKVDTLTQRPEAEVQKAIETAFAKVEPLLGQLHSRIDNIADRQPVIAGLDAVVGYLNAEKVVTRDRDGNITGWKARE